LKWIRDNGIPCTGKKIKFFGGLSQKRKNKQKTHKKLGKTSKKKGGKIHKKGTSKKQ
jgi:hypothetical protein